MLTRLNPPYHTRSLSDEQQNYVYHAQVHTYHYALIILLRIRDYDHDMFT
jgi:hypothetical protein